MYVTVNTAIHHKNWNFPIIFLSVSADAWMNALSKRTPWVIALIFVTVTNLFFDYKLCF